MRNPNKGGFEHPFGHDNPAALRVPAMSQALYPDLKTMMGEIHWLQNTHAECNPNFYPGSWDGCEPFYFNHGWESAPATAFYDGHVEIVGVPEAQGADSRSRNQVGYGLWARDTPWGEDGFLIGDSWDFLSETSYHVLTTDGIRGRDVLN